MHLFGICQRGAATLAEKEVFSVRCAQLRRRGRRAEQVCLGWAVAGTIVLAVGAIAARLRGLLGLGFDSRGEVGAPTVVLWGRADVALECERQE